MNMDVFAQAFSAYRFAIRMEVDREQRWEARRAMSKEAIDALREAERNSHDEYMAAVREREAASKTLNELIKAEALA